MNTTTKISNKFVIEGSLIGLNEYTKQNRTSRNYANDTKRTLQYMIRLYIKQHKVAPITEYPVILKINWYEKDKKRDADNIIFAKKFILDALVEEQILENDSQRFVTGFIENVSVDKDRPRIEVEICSIQKI